ncbi:hypothetical protein BG006_001293 [Podila minutissima]|uniref:Uncharacterized protein n=1 Tax=Podila minutissima TaxID=64525 RepID=A0A9P5SRD1_9FUNG|nr:hypothetical protein BG006_001293 [Podila minutissima]
MVFFVTAGLIKTSAFHGHSNRVSVEQAITALKAVKSKPASKTLLKATEALKALKLEPDNKPSIEQATDALNKLQIDWRSDNGGHTLGKALKTKSTLTTLNLRENQIWIKGLLAFSEAFKTNTTLVTLNLDDNQIMDEIDLVLFKSLMTKSTLTTLNMGHTSIEEDEAIALAEAFKTNSALITLDLQSNLIDDNGVQAFAEALKTNSTLTTLHLKNCIAFTSALFFAYCALVRYLYTGKVEFEVDLREFMITDWPITSPVQVSEQSADLQRLLAEPIKKVLPASLSKLADRYQLKELQVLF